MEKDIKNIIAEDLSGTINYEDSLILQAWLDSSEENKREYSKMRDIMALNGALSCEVSNIERVYNKVIGKKRRAIKYIYTASAAAAVIGLFFGLYIINTDVEQEKKSIISIVAENQSNDVVLVSNGNNYKINSNTNKVNLGGAEIYNNAQNNVVVFKTAGESNIIENKIIVPSGKIYKIVLHDGTQVTLNAKSTLIFPSAFKNEQRVVTLDGEAFFDVTPDASKQFIVKTKKCEVRVYGTVFNVNAYDSDSVNVVSLISGSVVTGNGKVEEKLKPGEQATTEEQIRVTSFNVDEVVGWTQMVFSFDDKPLCDIISAVERWYGVKFKFMNDNLKNVCAYVKVTKDIPLSELLDLLAATNKVKFECLGEDILIYPNK